MSEAFRLGKPLPPEPCDPCCISSSQSLPIPWLLPPPHAVPNSLIVQQSAVSTQSGERVITHGNKVLSPVGHGRSMEASRTMLGMNYDSFIVMRPFLSCSPWSFPTELSLSGTIDRTANIIFDFGASSFEWEPGVSALP